MFIFGGAKLGANTKRRACNSHAAKKQKRFKPMENPTEMLLGRLHFFYLLSRTKGLSTNADVLTCHLIA